MKAKTVTALCAMLLLAACSSDGAATGATPQSDAAAGSPGPLAAVNEPPAGIQPGSLDDFRQNVGDTIHFATDSYSLDGEAQHALQKQAAWLLQYRQHTITIEGHADERGTREYNLALGDRRGQTVVNYLTALGVDATRIKEVSYGKERPVCPDAGEACWSQNRRGVTTLDN